MGYVNGVPDFSDNPLCPQSFWWCCPNEHNLLGPLDTACCPASPVEFLEANHVKPFILETSWNHSLIALPRTPQTWLCPILAEIVPIVLATLVATILGKIVSMSSQILHQKISKDCFSYKVEPCIYVGWNLFTSSGWYPEIQQNYRKPQQKPNQIGGPFYWALFQLILTKMAFSFRVDFFTAFY